MFQASETENQREIAAFEPCMVT